MSKKGSAIGNNGSVFRQLKDPFSHAGKLGIFDKNKGYGGTRKDVPDSKKRICIIKTNNGKDLLHMWVGHFPGNPEKYHTELIKEREIIILIKIDVFRRSSNEEAIKSLKEKIFSECETRNRRNVK